MTRSNIARTDSLARSSSPRAEVTTVEPTLDQYYIALGKDLKADYEAGLMDKVTFLSRLSILRAEYAALKG